MLNLFLSIFNKCNILKEKYNNSYLLLEYDILTAKKRFSTLSECVKL